MTTKCTCAYELNVFSDPPRQCYACRTAAREARERFQDDLRDAHAEYMNEASGVSDDECREAEESYR